MRTDVAEIMGTVPYPCAVKVHHLMCTELRKLLDRISKIFPEIEAARPRCPSGIQALCSLHHAFERAKSILHYCSESSKLYLAMTGNKIASRCERSRDRLVHCLGQVQNMVSVMLQVQISGIIEDLRGVTFVLDSREEEAGKAVLAFFHQDTPALDSRENSDIEPLKLAVSKLHINSSRALLVERRSIKKLLDNVSDSEQTKKKMLNHLLYLLKKHEKLLLGDQIQDTGLQHEESFSYRSSLCTTVKEDSCVEYGKNEAQTDILSSSIPPQEFICPISLKLMYEPVVIASGQTFERMCIEKWFCEGNDICPKTQKKLPHLSMMPNTVMKDLILKWCVENGVIIPDPRIQTMVHNSWEASSISIASFGSSMNDICRRMDFVDVSLGSIDTSFSSDSSHVKVMNGSVLVPVTSSGDAHKFQPYDAIMHDTEPEYLSELAALSWDSQCKAVEGLKNYLVGSDRACYSMSPENLVGPLIKFLKDAKDLHDVKAQRSGTKLLLEFMRKCRSGEQCLQEDAFTLLASLFDSEVAKEALTIIEVLSSHQCCLSKITASGALNSVLKILTETRELREPAVKILYNLSSNIDVCSLIASLGCIPKLVPLMADSSLAKYCIIILSNLCKTEEARVSVADTNGCIASIAEILENGSHEDQEHALATLLSLCSQRVQYCELVMKERVVSSLFDISVNGSERGSASALELLRVLRDIDHTDVQEHPGSDLGISLDSGDNSNGKKPSSSTRTSGFFGRIFSKPTSLSSKKKT
ncbi:U-box domain-containing protein 5-like isoform X1 [Malania oleifera]|uniref:U-box domain-containing protein 5-like isoform X1 n=1 Tax=Malania oleifera TaxID=397392 RepID=UPI0025ADB543|nr:U-box domain-containing protein 5-like isoform X1 [Malania oleifera]XP_057966729.1 U-box domain-containing protein 5-like isoform X1 [Malania oleifera]